MYLSREEAVDLIGVVYNMRQSKNAIEKQLKPAEAKLKQYLALEDPANPFLHDGERGLSASLKEGSRDGGYDLKTMAEQEPGLLLELARMGCLRANATAIKATEAMATDPATLGRYAMPRTGYDILVVSEDE